MRQNAVMLDEVLIQVLQPLKGGRTVVEEALDTECPKVTHLARLTEHDTLREGRFSLIPNLKRTSVWKG